MLNFAFKQKNVETFLNLPRGNGLVAAMTNRNHATLYRDLQYFISFYFGLTPLLRQKKTIFRNYRNDQNQKLVKKS